MTQRCIDSPKTVWYINSTHWIAESLFWAWSDHWYTIITSTIHTVVKVNMVRVGLVQQVVQKIIVLILTLNMLNCFKNHERCICISYHTGFLLNRGRPQSQWSNPKCCLSHTHAVSANRILWVYAGFWWYHGILLVHLQDSVGAFGAKWLTKWLHHAKAPPHRGVLLWEWGNKDVHLVTTFVFCHMSKCYFFQQEFHCENVSAKCRSLVQVTPIELDFEVIFM